MIAMPQALFFGEQLSARSPGFDDLLVDSATARVTAYGPGAEVDALFAMPLTKSHVGVVQIRGERFRILAVPRQLYHALGDPFAIAGRFPAANVKSGPLEDLSWQVDTLQPRTIEQLRSVLKSDDGPTMLGASQALVDGGRVVFVRPSPDPEIIQKLWQLLPDSVRGELRVATFATSNRLGFELLVAPNAKEKDLTGYLRDDQAADYPQGQYELNLQIAVESGDQRELCRLLARRSSRQAMRLMFTILFVAILIGLASRFLLQ
jgi:hypothetical protein